MDKNELRDVVNEVIRASKEEKIPVSKLETALINVLKKKLNRELTEEEINYIKKSISREALTEEIEKNCSVGELENVFEKVAESKGIDATSTSLINGVFEISDKGFGTYFKEKIGLGEETDVSQKNDIFNPFFKETDRISNGIFKALAQSFSEIVENVDSNLTSEQKNIFKEVAKEKGKEILTEIVKTNSESAKKTGKLNPEEEKFIDNINSIINKFTS